MTLAAAALFSLAMIVALFVVAALVESREGSLARFRRLRHPCRQLPQVLPHVPHYHLRHLPIAQ